MVVARYTPGNAGHIFLTGRILHHQGVAFRKVSDIFDWCVEVFISHIKWTVQLITLKLPREYKISEHVLHAAESNTDFSE